MTYKLFFIFLMFFSTLCFGRWGLLSNKAALTLEEKKEQYDSQKDDIEGLFIEEEHLGKGKDGSLCRVNTSLQDGEAKKEWYAKKKFHSQKNKNEIRYDNTRNTLLTGDISRS